MGNKWRVKYPHQENVFTSAEIRGHSCHHNVRELTKIRNSKQRYRRSGKIRSGDSRKWNNSK